MSALQNIMTIFQNARGREIQENVNPNPEEFDLTHLPIRKIFTLIFIHDKEHDQLLLGQKLRGPLLGQWNGFGGKVEKGLESTNDSASRELEEEAFIKAPLFPIGFVQWVVSRTGDIDPEDETVYPYRDIMVIYKSHSFELCSSESQSRETCSQSQNGSTLERITEFKPSDEMAPKWWDADALPWDSMRVNHRVWYPFMLADRPYRAVYWYTTTQFSIKLDQDDPEKKDNAQRETVKEMWIEDVEKRCVEFGTRQVGKRVSEQREAEILSEYVAKLGLLESITVKKMQPPPAPIPNENLDISWLEAAITQAEKEWINSADTPTVTNKS